MINIGDFRGTTSLIRLILRRDWLVMLIWVLIVGLLPLANAVGAANLYPTTEALTAFVKETFDNATIHAFHGTVFGLSIGGFTV